MAENVLELFTKLPFFNCDYDTITEMFETPKNCVLERLKNNSFSENMIILLMDFPRIIIPVVTIRKKV